MDQKKGWENEEEHGRIGTWAVTFYAAMLLLTGNRSEALRRYDGERAKKVMKAPRPPKTLTD